MPSTWTGRILHPNHILLVLTAESHFNNISHPLTTAELYLKCNKILKWNSFFESVSAEATKKLRARQ